jgi:hypothetical protein
MIRKSLHCPVCGDVWKKVLYEHFLRLGPASHECRACWSRFATGNREWNDMDTATRSSYLLQNVVVVLPLLLMLIVACVVADLLGMVEVQDLTSYFLIGSVAIGGVFALCLVLELLSILRSKRRSAQAATNVTAKPAR